MIIILITNLLSYKILKKKKNFVKRWSIFVHIMFRIITLITLIKLKKKNYNICRTFAIIFADMFVVLAKEKNI